MRTGAMILAAAGVVLLAGCGREDAGLEEQERTASQELATTAETSDAFEDSTAVGVVPVQGADRPLTATGNLEGVAEGGPPGSVTVTEAPGGTTVLLDVTRYTVGSELAASLVRGSCDEAGSTVTRIGEPFRIGSGGIGRLEATIGTRTVELLDGRHSIRVHTPDSQAPDMVLACADLPALDR